MLVAFPKHLQRLALCISPTWEHKDIRQGKVVKRFQVGN